MELKGNALQKFISEDISKEDYDNFVSMVQEKAATTRARKSRDKKGEGRKSRNNQILCHLRTTQRVFTV
ncbi:MAG TPA: hypothetical protein VEY70_10920 [Metabacillus sp.]|nr:hypothetical protein [Metabacillus sp.]